MISVNFKIEDDTNKRLKIIAVQSGKTKEDVMVNALDEYAIKYVSDSLMRQVEAVE